MSEDTEEKKKLADFVKSVHRDLRKKFKSGEKSIGSIWEEHCQNTEILQDYAAAMQKLATEYWGPQQLERIQWCRKTLLEYFKSGGMKKCIEKDSKRLQRRNHIPERPRVLDVGSCYNPFKDLQEFEVIGIDLHPATEDVYQCDFLNLEIYNVEEPVKLFHTLSSPISRLPSCVFNVIIFCLLLEYFPSSQQRWKCCVQAHKLLAPDGLLVIISPDSHKQHRNSSMIRSWITAITSLGFSKWKYEKLEHIHCIVFRKMEDECCVTDDMAELMYIHQDALKEDLGDDNTGHNNPVVERDNEEIRQAMLELPGLPLDFED
ncbi:S-adenosylmethionine sensor upstream of mTORC1-like isoform X2 [Saccostrea echinata]|uniref:S-adenosylmethionine sensor upstream of mTORC1-like isoform X2 n=1 Tax=Saccostrea echinata TaxID=191078 RepID=UPI002A80DA06|nr:S-adenosylmethionine sensor upstream of mTORC1-like isoform X2 [Saccostrea echinata]